MSDLLRFGVCRGKHLEPTSMSYVDETNSEVGEILQHLRKVMKAGRFSQVRIQQELGWKGSYISQLFNRTKALRVSQLFMILAVMDYHPVDFFCDFYGEAKPGPEKEIIVVEKLQICFQNFADDLREILLVQSEEQTIER